MKRLGGDWLSDTDGTAVKRLGGGWLFTTDGTSVKKVRVGVRGEHVIRQD